ncbi:MAG: ABC transporter permease subunit [Planctomycetes bacterium]|nr:ABC transporter permease subunit [Planctomycetota bacterium]
MLSYVLRKLMYMPFILLGVIFITFVLFQMSTTPESLAKIQLGEKASARQIYEYLNEKGHVSWTDAGENKRALLGQGVLDNKRTQFFVAGRLAEMAEKRDDLRERIVDLHRDIAEAEADERAAHAELVGDADKPFRQSDDLKKRKQELGRAQKRQLENRIQIRAAILDARRVSQTLMLREKLSAGGLSGPALKQQVAARVAALQAVDAHHVEMAFLAEDVGILHEAEGPTDAIALGRQAVADEAAAIEKAIADHEAEAAGPDSSGPSFLRADWKACSDIRAKLADVEGIEPDLKYTAWYVKFVFYLGDIITLDFGDTNNRRPVMDVIKEGMWPSLALAIPGFLIAELIGVFFGLFAAMYRQTRVDHVIVVSSILLMSVNAIALIMFGQKFLAADLNYFPITGYAEGFGAMRFLVLPIILYITITFGERVRFNRIVMLDETNQDYVRTARSKGLSENGILFKHILRNTLIPLITRWVVAIPSLYLGSLVLETFFAIPGLGYMTVDAIANSDANVIRAVVVFGSVSFMLAALLSDVLYAVVDPRVKLS